MMFYKQFKLLFISTAANTSPYLLKQFDEQRSPTKGKAQIESSYD